MLLYIPVVFFTARGIPGEVDERHDTAEGIISASIRSLGAGGDGAKGGGEDNDEAEYAWLPLDCIKPFRLGDVATAQGLPPQEDASLRLSVAAAEAALRASLVSTGSGGGAAGTSGADSDSDGGWGIPSVPAPQAGIGLVGRRLGEPRVTHGHESMAHWGNGSIKIGRQGSAPPPGAATGSSDARQGRIGSPPVTAGWYPGDEDWSDSEMLYDGIGGLGAMGGLLAPTAGAKFIVESILGWRYPLTEAQQQTEK